MRRILAGLPAGLLAASILTRCGDSAAVSSADSGSATSTTPEKAVIWGYLGTDAQKEMMKIMIDSFSAEQKKYMTEHVYVPLADYKKQLTLGMTSRQPSDLAILDGYSVASFISMSLFIDISDADIRWSECIAGPIESVIIDGKRCGIPFTTNCMALFYNEDLFNMAGLKYLDESITWKEFHRATKALTKNSMYGFGDVTTDTDEGTFQCLQWLCIAGGPYKDTKSGMDAYRLMRGMVKEGSWTEEVVNWAQSDVNDSFMAGNSAIQQDGPQQVSNIETDAPDLNHGMMVLPKKNASLPQVISILDGENMGVIKKGDVSDALAFLRYYDKMDIMVQATKQYDSFPPKTEAVEGAYWTGDPIQAAFIKQLDASIPRESSPL